MYTIEIQVRDEHGQIVGAPARLADRGSQFAALEYMMSVVDASAQIEYWCQPTTTESELRLAVDLAQQPMGFKYHIRLGSVQSTLLVAMDDTL